MADPMHQFEIHKVVDLPSFTLPGVGAIDMSITNSTVAMLAAALIGIWQADNHIRKLQLSIEERQQVLQKLQDDTLGIQIINCQLAGGGSTVPCVAVDPTAPAWGKNGEYRAILPKKD